MKEYFMRMLDYDRRANLRILEAILTTGMPEKPMHLMAHMLAAQQIWLKRCKNQPAMGGALWPTDWTVMQMQDTVEENFADWSQHIEQLDDAAWQQAVNYQNFKGETCHDKLIDILAHLINHGTHHRAQAGMHLKQAGAEHLPGTDYILYARNQL